MATLGARGPGRGWRPRSGAKSSIIIIAVFALVLGSITGVAWWRYDPPAEDAGMSLPPALVRTDDLRTRRYVVRQELYGFLEADAELDLAMQIPGRVDRLAEVAGRQIREGDRVRRGDLLLRLEPDRYEAALRMAEAEQARAQAMMNEARAAVDEVRARVEDARIDVERLRGMAEAGVGQQRPLQQAEALLRSTQAQLAAAQARLSAASASYTGAEAAAAAARVNLADTELRAPRDAVVASVDVEIGQMLQPGQVVFRLVDTTRLKLVSGVVERNVTPLEPGQRARVYVMALEAAAALSSAAAEQAGPRAGVIAVAPPAPNPATGLFDVEVELLGVDESLRPGLAARAEVEIETIDAAVVPADAVLTRGDRAYAYFVDHGLEIGLDLGAVGRASFTSPTAVARRVELEPVAIDQGDYLLARPPEDLGLLVVEGQSRLRDGQTVRVVPVRTRAVSAQ